MFKGINQTLSGNPVVKNKSVRKTTLSEANADDAFDMGHDDSEDGEAEKAISVISKHSEKSKHS